jgi:hypothetical protein
VRYRTIGVERVVAETDAAVLLRVDGDERWIPKSLIEDVASIDVGDESFEAEIAEWFCEKEGL